MFGKAVEFVLYELVARLFDFIFIKELNGIENIPDNQGCIIAANHTSFLDIPSLSAPISLYKKKKIRYVAKRELFRVPVFKAILKENKMIPMGRGKHNMKMFKSAIKALQTKDIVVMYPEGTRSVAGKIQKGKTGVARLVLWARVPVVPVGIKGAFELMPRGKIIPKFKKNIKINIGKPIYFDKYYKRNMTKKLLRQLTNKVMKEIAKLSGQSYQQ